MTLTKEQIVQIENLTNTATEVYEFIMNIPSPLGEFVFKRIIENAYEIASVLQPDVVKKQLIEAVSYHMDTSKDMNLVYNYLGVVNHYKELDEVFMEKEKLIECLNRYCSFNELPLQNLLIRSYACFSPGAEGEEWKKNLKVDIRKKIIEDIQKEEVYPQYNCFQELGYKTLLPNYILGGHSKYRELFSDWYCKGSILSFVIDTVHKCNVNTISVSLWKHIQSECKKHQYLSEAFQKCYESYGVFSNTEKKFEYEGKEDKSTTHLVLALPQIIIDPNKDTKKANFATYDMLYDLHRRLTKRGDIDCGFEAFKAVFSGRENMVQPIMWKTKQQHLANFLCVLRGGEHAKDSQYAKTAATVFIQKDRKPCKFNTLNQEDTQSKSYNEYKELFRAIGLNR